MAEADDYSENLISPFKVRSRALLLTTVVHGNPRKLYCADTSASSLRSGFHSVGNSRLHDLAELMYCRCTGDGSP